MNSRIDVITKNGIIGLEVRKNISCLMPNCYKPEIGSVVCYFDYQIVGNDCENAPRKHDAIEYLKENAVAYCPLYLFGDRLTNEVFVRTSGEGSESIQRMSDGACGYLYLTHKQVELRNGRGSKASQVRRFRANVEKAAKEFSYVLNHKVYEYQVYLNFEPITSVRKYFYGDYFESMLKISQDFTTTVNHPTFLEGGTSYLLEHIEQGRNLAKVWALSPEEQKMSVEYFILCINNKVMEQCCSEFNGDTQRWKDAECSIAEIHEGMDIIKCVTGKSKKSLIQLVMETK